MRKPNRKVHSRKPMFLQKSQAPMLVVAGVIGIVVIGGWLFHASGVLPYVKMLQEVERLQTEIQELEDHNRLLQEEIARVEQDPTRLEELARNQLGLVRKGEVVYQIVEPK